MLCQEALAEEARMKAKFENDTLIAKAKRDYELKKAAYDIEVQTKVLFKSFHRQPVKTAISLHSSPLGTFHQEGRLHLSNRNSMLMMENLSGNWSGVLIGQRSSYIVLAIVY